MTYAVERQAYIAFATGLTRNSMGRLATTPEKRNLGKCATMIFVFACSARVVGASGAVICDAATAASGLAMIDDRMRLIRSGNKKTITILFQHVCDRGAVALATCALAAGALHLCGARTPPTSPMSGCSIPSRRTG